MQEYCTQLSAIAEANPDLFHRFTYMPMLVSVRERIAKLIGVADPDEVVIVPNASHGLNTVLRNIIWEDGDVIVPCECLNFKEHGLVSLVHKVTTTYNSISRTAQYISDIPPHPRIAQFDVQFPTSHALIIENWRTHLRSVKASSKKCKVRCLLNLCLRPPLTRPRSSRSSTQSHRIPGC